MLNVLGNGERWTYHVSKQRLGNVDADAAEEDEKEEEPFEVLDKRRNECSLAGPVAESGERDVAEAVEDYDERNPDVPRIDIVLVNVALVPTDDDVVDDRHDPGGADGVVGSDVGDDVDLGGDRHVGAQEATEERRKWTANKPEADRVEHELVTAVSVLLPSSQFIVDGERDTFLESVAGPCSEASDVALDLKAEGHIKIL